MYEKLFEQSERLFKPFNDIWALQAQAAESLAKAQTSAMTDVWNQGVLALQNIPAQKSVEDVLKLQQSYWETMQGSLQEMFDSAQDVIIETNRKISAVLQQSSDSAVKAASKAVKPTVPVKTVSEALKKPVPVAKKPAASTKASVPSKGNAQSVSKLPIKATPSNNGKAAEPARQVTKSDGKTEPTKAATPEAAAKKSD